VSLRPGGVSVLVGGGAADVDDVVARVWADFPRTAAFIVVYALAIILLVPSTPLTIAGDGGAASTL